MVWLPDGEKNFKDMYNRLDRIPACDRDRRTDRQTSCHGINRAMHTPNKFKTNVLISYNCKTSKSFLYCSRILNQHTAAYTFFGTTSLNNVE